MQQLLYGITDNHIAQLEQAASNCVSLLEHVSTPREHAFLSVMIFFCLKLCLCCKLTIYYCKLQGVNREGSFFLRVSGGRPSACKLI